MTARRSFYLAAIDSYLEAIVTLLSTVILARLLTPGEIGTFSIAASVTGVAHALREMGVGNYLVQEKELTTARIRAAFTVSILGAWTLGAAVLTASPWVTGFYQNPELMPVLVVLALNFFLLPFGLITLAYLRRSMLFGRSLIINASGSAARLAVSISLALSGFGALSLALGTSAGLIVTVLLAILLRPKSLPWLPGVRELRRVLEFGLTLTGASLVGSANDSAPDLIIGKVLGAADTGIFNKALGLTTMINNIILQPLWKFMMPYFAQKNRDGEDVSIIYLNTVSIVTGLMWPALITAAIAAEPIVRLLLGPQWLDAIPLSRILCLAAGFGAAFASFGSLLIASSRADLYLRVATVGSGVRVGFLLVAVWFGLEAVAWSFVVSAIVSGAYSAFLLRRDMAISTRDLLIACKKSAWITATVAPFALAAAWLSAVFELSSLLSLPVIVTVVATAWMATARRIHPQAAQEAFHLLDLVRGHLRFRRSPS